MDMPSVENLETRALSLLALLTNNPQATFRGRQYQAIEALLDGDRVFVVERTGFGKSAIYFIATKLLRDRGKGFAIMISPLIALMDDQIRAARHMGLRTETINSYNKDDWGEVYSRLESGSVDLLLLSPERWANPSFRKRVENLMIDTSLLIVDEAHCISDWGHDFRPDYRRINKLLNLLPGGVPVLACTATANDRVVEDIERQITLKSNSNQGLKVFRGPLQRDGLRLAARELKLPAERLVWLKKFLETNSGSGLIYCLTKRDVDRVSSYLETVGISVSPYHGGIEKEMKHRAIEDILGNKIRALVCTNAIGMGFDKPDLAFVIHYQSPKTVIEYYQQVGRAGRSIDTSIGVLFEGQEDEEIQNFFIDSAFSNPQLIERVLSLMGDFEWWTLPKLLQRININKGSLTNLMKNLDVEGLVTNEGNPRGSSQCWRKTRERYVRDEERTRQITALRYDEQSQVQSYIRTETCRMVYLTEVLDGVDLDSCGICENCDESFSLDPYLASGVVELGEAEEFLRNQPYLIEPREKGIPEPLRFVSGFAMCHLYDGVWGAEVENWKQSGNLSGGLIEKARVFLDENFLGIKDKVFVPVPSLRNPGLVCDLVENLASMFGSRYEKCVKKVIDTPMQIAQMNAQHQKQNVQGAFGLGPDFDPAGCDIILVDDVVHSRWTITEIAKLLLDNGAHTVQPFAMAISKN